MGAEDEESGELLTVVQVARMWGVSPRTIFRWINLGKMPCIVSSQGRTVLRRSDVEEMIMTRTPSDELPQK